MKKQIAVVIACSLAFNPITAVSVESLVKREPRRIKIKRGWVPGVRVLNLSSMGITSLEGLEGIPGIEKVTRLYLDNNNIQTIESGDLAAASNLVVLSLSGNGLKDIKPNAFAGLKNLKVLNLSNNRINATPQGGLNGMPNLRFLGMSDNPMPNPKVSLQSQVPRAFITTLPITKANIRKWGAIVGAGIAALVGTIAAVKKLKGRVTTEEVSVKPVSKKDSKKLDQLVKAIKECDVNQLRTLLVNTNPKVLLQTKMVEGGLSLIDHAIGAGCDIDIIKALIHKNPKIVNLRSIGDMTPLHRAVYSADEGLVKLLIENGAQVNAKDIAGRTPLFYVSNLPPEGMTISQEQLEEINKNIIQLLLAQGADVNIQDKRGNTVLHLLLGQRNPDKNIKIVKQLLEQGGIDTTIRNNDKQKAIDLAKYSSAQQIIKKYGVKLGYYGDFSPTDPMA